MCVNFATALKIRDGRKLALSQKRENSAIAKYMYRDFTAHDPKTVIVVFCERWKQSLANFNLYKNIKRGCFGNFRFFFPIFFRKNMNFKPTIKDGQQALQEWRTCITQRHVVF